MSEAQVINNARLDMRRFGYKRDSLVAAWDYSEGLDATGWTSAFSADGEDHTFVWTGSNKGTIEADSTKGLRFTGVENAYGVLSPGDCDKTFNLATNGTMEIVVIRESTDTACALQISQANGNQCLYFYIYNGKHYYACCNYTSGNKGPWYLIEEDTLLRRSFAATYTASRAVATYENGKQKDVAFNDNFGNGTQGAILGCNQGLNRPFKGRIFAIRLYKEKLNATQLAAHAEADRLCMPNLVTALSSDETKGAVSGETPVLAGTPFTVTAKPAFGFRFLRWENMDSSFLSYEKTLTTSFPLHRQIVARFVDASDLDYNTANKSLVAMWDCSRGLDANGWTSCYSTNGDPYTFAWTGKNKDAITFTATNGVRFTGVANAYGVLPPADCASTFNLARNGTMEIVVVREATSGNACALQVSRACGDQTLFFYTITAGSRFSCCNGISGEKGQWYSMKEDSNLLRVFSATYTDGYTNNDKVFQNGEEATKAELDNFGVKDLGAVLGSNQNNACPFKGRVLAIRLYSEKLSEEKIAQNYTNDTIRFTTCVQTIQTRVAEDSEGCGSVTAGGDYILGTSVTLTATPAPGYKFSHWAGDIDGLDVSSSTLTFAVDVSRDLEAVFTRRPGLILIFR